jgi:hypothetical protein
MTGSSVPENVRAGYLITPILILLSVPRRRGWSSRCLPFGPVIVAERVQDPPEQLVEPERVILLPFGPVTVSEEEN